MTTDARQLLLLLNWMSPAFPTGAFAYSHGLEWAIESGAVKTGEQVRQWIEDLLTQGSGWNDAVIFARCYEDDAAPLNDLALALCSSRERYLETTQLGKAFEIAVNVFAPRSGEKEGTHRDSNGGDEGLPATPLLSQRLRRRAPFLSPLPGGEDKLAYPVAAGVACNEIGIGELDALLAFLQGFAAALTSVAVRLVPLGQTAGLVVLRDLMPVISATAKRAAAATLDDLGSISLLSDIAAMKHESQHSRVFRT